MDSPPEKVTSEWYNLTFQSDFPDMPFLIAGMQTYNGSDTAAIRSQNPSANSIQVKIEEEASKDIETDHTTEVVGYLVIGAEVSTEGTETFISSADQLSQPATSFALLFQQFL